MSSATAEPETTRKPPKDRTKLAWPIFLVTLVFAAAATWLVIDGNAPDPGAGSAAEQSSEVDAAGSQASTPGITISAAESAIERTGLDIQRQSENQDEVRAIAPVPVDATLFATQNTTKFHLVQFSTAGDAREGREAALEGLGGGPDKSEAVAIGNVVLVAVGNDRQPGEAEAIAQALRDLAQRTKIDA